MAVIPAPVTPAVERMLQVTHSTILSATFVHCTLVVKQMHDR
jgi:hypothetical protein